MQPLIDTQELWVEVRGYEGLYEVSDKGNVRSLDRYEMFGGRHPTPTKRLRKGKLLSVRGGLYKSLVLHKDGVGKPISVHRLVALHFCDNPDNKPEVNHIDEDRHNNCSSNLEWVTRKENAMHSCYKQKGEKSGTAKLKDKEVIEIKRLLLEDELSQVEIAKMFDVSNHAIFKIKVGVNWAWLTGFGKEGRCT